MVKQTELKKQDVIDEMTWNDKIDSSDIQVKVYDGKVELSGTVGSFMERREAEMDAWLVSGVRHVENNITVDLTEGITYPSDEELKQRIENVLIWDATLNSLKIDVSVSNGIVTLEGTVDSFWKISFAESKVHGVSGVVGIINKLAAAPEESVADEMIAKDIMDAIERKLLVSPDDVDVKVKNGVVTLEGTATSWSAWREAYNSAEYTIGVLDINDNIIISP